MSRHPGIFSCFMWSICKTHLWWYKLRKMPCLNKHTKNTLKQYIHVVVIYFVMSSSTHNNFQLNLNKYIYIILYICISFSFVILLHNHILALAYPRVLCSVTYKMLRYGIQSASWCDEQTYTQIGYRNWMEVHKCHVKSPAR